MLDNEIVVIYFFDITEYVWDTSRPATILEKAGLVKAMWGGQLQGVGEPFNV